MRRTQSFTPIQRNNSKTLHNFHRNASSVKRLTYHLQDYQEP